MDKNFARIMTVLARYEGGYVNHPNDPGGPTNKGVTQRVYDAYRKGRGEPTRSVKQLTESEWHDIFRRQYWTLINGPRLPDGIDMVVMDGAVHSGVYQSGKWLQRALGSYYQGKDDGHIGERTLEALAAHPDHDAVIEGYLARRLGMMQNLKTWGVFGRGWSARIANVLEIGQAWAMGSVGPAPVDAYAMGGAAKAYASDIEEAPLPEAMGTQTAGAGGGLAALVETARQNLAPLVGTSDLVNNIFVAITVVGVVFAVGGVVYGFWAARKNRKARAAIDGNVVAAIPSADDALAAAAMA